MSFYREFVRSFLINYEKSVDFAVELGYIIAHIVQDPTLSNASGGLYVLSLSVHDGLSTGR